MFMPVLNQVSGNKNSPYPTPEDLSNENDDEVETIRYKSAMLRQFLIARRVLYDAFGHFNLADGWALASHVALSTLLALFPFLIFATTLANFLGADQFSETAVKLVFDTWPENIAAPLAREVENVLTVPRGGLLTLSVIVAAVFASNGVEALRVALNRAYRVSEQRNYFYLRAQSLAIVLLATLGLLAIGVLLILAPIVINFAEDIVHVLPWMSDVSIPGGWLRVLIALLLIATGLLFVHKWLPAGKRSIGGIAPGICVTIVFWAIGASLFAAYLDSFSTYASTYAGLASIMIALVFLYIIAAIFILGAELNAAILQFRRARAHLAPYNREHAAGPDARNN